MNRRNYSGTVLIALAVILFVVPAIFPVQPMLVHQTEDITTSPPDRLEQEGYEVIAYENLSERAQQLYVKTLENGGEYRVPLDRGAPEFDYLTPAERREAHENGNQSAIRGVAVERPENDDALPPADEPGIESSEGEHEADEGSDRQQVIARYDAMSTATEQPPLGAVPQLLRLAAVLLAVVALGVGGYLLSSK